MKKTGINAAYILMKRDKYINKKSIRQQGVLCQEAGYGVVLWHDLGVRGGSEKMRLTLSSEWQEGAS